MSEKRVVVTGSEGFLGSILCKRLRIPDTDKYDEVKGKDVCESKVQDELVKGAHVIIHLAAISGIAACEKDPDIALATNTEATIEIARKAKKNGVRRIIFSSSSAVYGEAQDFVMNENHPCEPRTLYGKSKHQAEAILKLASPTFEVIILRKSNLYGWGTKWKGITVADQFIDKFLSKSSFEITGSGSQKRDFVHVIDVLNVYAKLTAATRVRSGIYNLGGTETMSIRQLAELTNDIGETILGYRVSVNYKPVTNEALWHDFRYDFSKAMKEFQYQPVITLDNYIN